ncbi:MAG: spore coat associated protein CotJA [Eubacterium sp.]|nr:spore coat associated protein CotJA [Eubacterium sp.]
MTIGMGYVPWQKWQNIYDMDEAIKRGTIFEELDKPYLGRPVKS